jgi:hypothetical protein
MCLWWALLIGFTARAGTGLKVKEGDCALDTDGCLLSHPDFNLDGSTMYQSNANCKVEAEEDLTIGIVRFRTEMQYDWVAIMENMNVPRADQVCYSIPPYQEDQCLSAGCCYYDYMWGNCQPQNGFWDLPCVQSEDAHSGSWCGQFQDPATCDDEKFTITTGQVISWTSDGGYEETGFKLCPMIIKCNPPSFPEFGGAVYCPNSPPRQNDVCLLSCANGYRADPPEVICIEEDNYIIGKCVPCTDEPASFDVFACSTYEAIPSGSSLAFVDSLVETLA